MQLLSPLPLDSFKGCAYNVLREDSLQSNRNNSNVAFIFPKRKANLLCCCHFSICVVSWLSIARECRNGKALGWLKRFHHSDDSLCHWSYLRHSTDGLATCQNSHTTTTQLLRVCALMSECHDGVEGNGEVGWGIPLCGNSNWNVCAPIEDIKFNKRETWQPILPDRLIPNLSIHYPVSSINNT